MGPVGWRRVPGIFGNPGGLFRSYLVEVDLQTFARRYEKLDAMGTRVTGPASAEDKLTARARSGDADAFRELMDAHLPQVWRVVWRILRHREDTEDVVQEVFLSAHRSLETFRGDSQLSTWLHRIAVNRALNYLNLAAERVRHASESLEGPDPAETEGCLETPGQTLATASPSPLQELEMKELRRRVAECMKKIPPLWRAVLGLRDGESLSYEEIAARMEIALGTVRSRLARARLALRRCVEGEAA